MSKKGFTLMEVLVATLCLAVVFLGVASLYTSGHQFFRNIEARQMRASLLAAVEYIERRAAQGNFVQVDDSINIAGDQIKVRWDYNTDYANPIRTPGNVADDWWIKFAIIEGRLRFRADGPGNQAADVTENDPEVIPGLLIQHLTDEGDIVSRFGFNNGVLTIELHAQGLGEDSAVFVRVWPKALTV